MSHITHLCKSVISGQVSATVPLLDFLREIEDVRHVKLQELVGGLLRCSRGTYTGVVGEERVAHVSGWRKFVQGFEALMWWELEDSPLAAIASIEDRMGTENLASESMRDEGELDEARQTQFHAQVPPPGLTPNEVREIRRRVQPSQT